MHCAVWVKVVLYCNWVTSQRPAKWSYSTTGSPPSANVAVPPPNSQRPPKPVQSVWIAAGASCNAPVDLSYTATVTFTICTNCVAPTAPLVSGGTKAKPNKLRLSCALCPSKLLRRVTPVSGPASGAATGSELGLVIIAPVARAVGLWLSLLPPLEDAPIAICDRGGEASWREALITSGPFAKATDTDKKTKTTEKNHRDERTTMAHFIGPPDLRSVRGGRHSN